LIKATVQLQGGVGNLIGVKPGQSLELSLPEGSTAGHVLRELGRRFGTPFPDPSTDLGEALHASLRVFVNDELSVRPDQTFLDNGASSSNVTVMIISAISGGA